MNDGQLYMKDWPWHCPQKVLKKKKKDRYIFQNKIVSLIPQRGERGPSPIGTPKA